MTVNDGGFLNAVRDGSCTHVLNLLENGGIDLEQRDQVKNSWVIFNYNAPLLNLSKSIKLYGYSPIFLCTFFSLWMYYLMIKIWKWYY